MNSDTLNKESSHIRGFLSTLNSVNEAISNYEAETNSSFVVIKKDKLFGSDITSIQDLKVGRIYFENAKKVSKSPKIAFDGIPFIHVGEKVYGCHQGKDKHSTEKKRYQENAQQIELGHSFKKKRRCYSQTTKKCDCPAKIMIHHVIKFPKFKLTTDSKWKRKRISKELRSRLNNADKSLASPLDHETRFYIKLPAQNEHRNHLTGEAARIPDSLDDRIIERIMQLTHEGIRSVAEMKEHLLKSRFPPDNRMTRSTQTCSKVDQENFQEPQDSNKNTTSVDGTRNAPIKINDEWPNPRYWMQHNNGSISITLYKESENNILNPNGWLTDTEIHAGQQLLKSQFNYIGGFVDPAVCHHLVQPEPFLQFVQIVNSGSHWVTLSTMGCPVGTVNIYDSGKSRTVNSIVQNHAARMMSLPSRNLTFIRQPVQEQRGDCDCGLFALAYATSICFGEDPVTRRYQQHLLRRHYHSCLSSLRMQSFPSVSRPSSLIGKQESFVVPVFCICRIPNDGNKYAQCRSCHEWYHPTCVNIPKSALKKRIAWLCDKCKQ